MSMVWPTVGSRMAKEQNRLWLIKYLSTCLSVRPSVHPSICLSNYLLLSSDVTSPRVQANAFGGHENIGSSAGSRRNGRHGDGHRSDSHVQPDVCRPGRRRSAQAFAVGERCHRLLYRHRSHGCGALSQHMHRQQRSHRGEGARGGLPPNQDCRIWFLKTSAFRFLKTLKTSKAQFIFKGFFLFCVI